MDLVESNQRRCQDPHKQLGTHKWGHMLKNQPPQGRLANGEKRPRTPKRLTELTEVTKLPITGTKGENPSPRLKTNIIPELEKTIEETSETEAINGPDHVTTFKTEG